MNNFKQFANKENMPQHQILWHVSNEHFYKFDLKKTAQGIIWFAKDAESLVKDLHGASINNQKPVYLYKCIVNPRKIANWDQYEKLSIGELRRDGFDSIDLDEDFVVLNPTIVKILKITKVNYENI